MKILVFSDIHGDRAALRRLMAIEADYYFAAGDLASWGRGLDAAGEILAERGSRAYVLPGNHETAAAVERLCERWELSPLHERTIELGGCRIAGLGYSSPTPFRTPGEYTEDELKSRLAAFAALPPRVLICHSPPYGTRLDSLGNGRHAGSRAVSEFLRDSPPDFFFCGHVHEAHGVSERIGVTRAWNTGKAGVLLDFDKLES